MPKLMNTSTAVVQQTVSNFGFSATRPDDLQGNEYTIVDLEVDISSSVASFATDLKKALETVVDTLLLSPYADRILLRVGTFGSDVDEIHGFVPLTDIDKASYKLNVGGSTALYDASLIGVEAIDKYSGDLSALEYDVSGLRIVATDGGENASTTCRSAGAIKKAVDSVNKKEKLHEFKSILIGIGGDSVQSYLDSFKNDAGFDQFVNIGDATPSSLAKMAGFISRSVSSSSQALATGGQSQALTF